MTNQVPVLLVCDEEFAPVYAKAGDAGADLRSVEDLIIPNGARSLVRTGVRIALPEGYVGLVHPRSGLALKHGITVLNSPGTIDAGYRGEIMVTLYNSGTDDFEVKVGDRIAQLIVQEFAQARFIRVEKLPDTDRSDSGLGSTGSR